MDEKELTKEQKHLRMLVAEAINDLRKDACWSNLVVWALGYFKWDGDDILIQRCRPETKAPYAYCGKCSRYFKKETDHEN